MLLAFQGGDNFLGELFQGFLGVKTFNIKDDVLKTHGTQSLATIDDILNVTFLEVRSLQGSLFDLFIRSANILAVSL